jgi:hypothetical protein
MATSHPVMRPVNAANGQARRALMSALRTDWPQGEADRLVRLLAGIRTVFPNWTLQQIALPDAGQDTGRVPRTQGYL